MTTITVQRDYAAYCKLCGTIEQFDFDAVQASCYEDGQYYGCDDRIKGECFDHPRVLYVVCKNNHRLVVGDPQVIFFGGRLSALRLFCVFCVKFKCDCSKKK